MQYCKNCGRQLKEGTRFCDRCGRSVRQGRSGGNLKKQEQIEKLQRERLERKRRQEQRENIENKRKERRRRKREKQSKVLLALLGIIAAIVIIAVISFVATSKGSENAAWKSNGNESVNTTSVPTMQPSATSVPVSPVMPGENDAMNTIAGKDDYGVFEISNDMEIPYPEVFEEEEASGITELFLTDKMGGGATMKVSCEEYPGGTPSDLMKKFATEHDGRITYSLAGSNWYGITVDDDGKISHRKYIIDRSNDCVVHYDFEYKNESDYAEDYAAYIDYIDTEFDY